MRLTELFLQSLVILNMLYAHLSGIFIGTLKPNLFLYHPECTELFSFNIVHGQAIEITKYVNIL